jgi:NAD(P)H dehydrogenase (quinone)
MWLPHRAGTAPARSVTRSLEEEARMKTFLILAHPEPRSFNAAMHLAAAGALRAAGHEVRTSDLCATGFQPVSDRRNFTTVKDPDYLKLQLEEMHATEHAGFAADVEEELAKLEWCDLMVWQFPLWWFGPPAVLKGWADRVLAMGRAYGGGRIYGTGMFRGRRAMLSLTTGGPAPAYEKGGFNGDIHAILKPLHRGILQFTGFDVLAPHICYAPVRQDDDTRRRWIGEYAARMKAIAAEPPIEVGEY